MNEDAKRPLQAWADKIDFTKRAKAICKPCWELKYCPYGPLVEEFPLAGDPTDKSCRIFGHDCPVFYVAEPLTETKQLRNISRKIPRPTQFKVLKRENQVCRICGQPVQDEDIHFDHIIPWSKGGPSEEHNIQLLCGCCNRKKGVSFEDEFLVTSVMDHIIEPVSADIIDMLSFIMSFAHNFRAERGHYPDADDFAESLNDGEKTLVEVRGAEIVGDFETFFAGEKPKEIKTAEFRALAFRWGFEGGTVVKLIKAAKRFNINPEALFNAEKSLIARLGWRVELEEKEKEKWLRK
jgi:hypothetical protein